MELGFGVPKGMLGKTNVSEQKEFKGIEKYKAYKEKGTVLEQLRFTTADEHEGMWFMDGNIKVMAPVSEIYFTNKKKEELYVSDDSLKREYAAIVTDVDDENGIVYISVNAVRRKYAPKLERQLLDQLEKGECPVVNARVNKVVRPDFGDARRLFLELEGLGVPATLDVTEWAHSYTKDLSEVVSEGDVLTNIAVIGTNEHSYLGMKVFKCSRKKMLKDSWQEIEEKLHPGQFVVVRCLNMFEISFLSEIIGYEGVTATSLYPDSRDPATGRVPFIAVGRKYTGEIKLVDASKKRIRVKILSEYHED